MEDQENLYQDTTLSPIPNPGSKEAVLNFCICAKIDNGHGKGAYGGAVKDENGKPLFWITEGCPLHDSRPKEEASP